MGYMKKMGNSKEGKVGKKEWFVGSVWSSSRGTELGRSFSGERKLVGKPGCVTRDLISAGYRRQRGKSLNSAYVITPSE